MGDNDFSDALALSQELGDVLDGKPEALALAALAGLVAFIIERGGQIEDEDEVAKRITAFMDKVSGMLGFASETTVEYVN